MTNVIQFAAQQAECSVFDCAAVIGAGICVATAIGVPGGVAAAIACVAGGAPSVRTPSNSTPHISFLFDMVKRTDSGSSALALDASTRLATF